MKIYEFGYTIACLLSLYGGHQSFARTTGSEHENSIAFEEYLVEHEVSSKQARDSALITEIDDSPHAGCQECSLQEKRYCLGTNLINDHCCCDQRHHEQLPFVPHTCYVGAELCKPVIGDCGTYRRLLVCCCKKYALDKWKALSAGAHHHACYTYLLILYIIKCIVSYCKQPL